MIRIGGYLQSLLVLLILKAQADKNSQCLARASHPLDPLTSQEMRKTSELVRAQFRQRAIVFSTVTLKEPPKSDLLPYFLQDTPPPSDIPRKSFAVIIDVVTEAAYEVVVNLRRQKIESVVKVAQDLSPMFASDEDDDAAATALGNPAVQRRLALLGVRNVSSMVARSWAFSFANDRPEYIGKRIVQMLLTTFMVENDNHYVHPFGFAVIVDVLKKEVLEIEEFPIHAGFDAKNRKGDSFPKDLHNYDPLFMSKSFYRKDVSPILISQPAGPGYKVHGNQIKWQNFQFRVGFNDREGLVLYNINYNDKGTVRPLIYRASIPELFVPYGDPRPPFHRKMAFDAGSFGLGLSAHQLIEPSDCRGSVTFFSFVISSKAGLPVPIKQAVCVYEESVGILLKKFDKTTRRAFTARSQRLVVTFTATEGNYDYQFNWMFYQDASIRMEVHLHGIDNTIFNTRDSPTNAYGTMLTPEMNAQNHQHFLVARIDAEIDGNQNTVVMVDGVSTGPTGSDRNPYGNGFKSQATVLKTALKGRTNSNYATSRTWSIIGSPDKINPVSNAPKGYRLIADNPIKLLMNSDSPLHPKCAFVDYTVWVTPYEEDQLYPGGYYLNKSGLPEWTARNPKANIENTDIVLWHIFGTTHFPRAEDFPIMPIQ